MTEILATYTCNQPGEWGPYHAMIPGPSTGQDRWGPTRDRNKDKTLCGIRITDMWERDKVDVARIECQRCRAALKKRGELDPRSRLLTPALRKALPGLYDREDDDDPLVVCKFFTPDSNWTWYAIEFDGEDTFFGFVDGLYPELGYFSLQELESARGPLGLLVERDHWFKPAPLSAIRAKIDR